MNRLTSPRPGAVRAGALAALALLACLTAAPAARAADPVPARGTVGDTMRFTPLQPAINESSLLRALPAEDATWRRAPYGDALLMHPDPWRARFPNGGLHGDLLLDYDRVDLVRYGAWLQVQRPETMLPRAAARLEYATGRRRVLFGAQFEQPLLPTARFVAGIDYSRRTDHGDLQQHDDAENSLLLLLAHEDWRDYFEREGGGGYLAWRVPDFSTVSVHLRADRYRSLVASPHVKSWFRLDRPLRANPAIDDGDARRVIVRLERLAHTSPQKRGGLYHWIELESAGGGLGGDFDYARVLADVRSVVRLSPATSLAVRAAGGSTLHGTLPAQRRFTLGGVDGLRAHPFDSREGDQLALAQLEYSVQLHGLGGRVLPGGPRLLAFVDSGTAWNRATGGELSAQRFALDGGIGLATPDDDLRVTAARDLHDPDGRVVVTIGLRHPF